MKRILSILLLSFFTTLILVVVFNFISRNNFSPQPTSEQSAPNEQENLTNPQTAQAQVQTTTSIVQVPMQNWQNRITKKPFGIFIDSKTSPIQPEKFQGFHTGTDFEIFENEVERQMEIKSICKGKILQKKIVSGYGGVIIQSCGFENTPLTVLYGHLDLEESISKIGDIVEKNKSIAFLAQDKSFYSNGERKHLHLGIHKGTQIELQGYVKTKNQLVSWLDFEKIQDLLE